MNERAIIFKMFGFCLLILVFTVSLNDSEQDNVITMATLLYSNLPTQVLNVEVPKNSLYKPCKDVCPRYKFHPADLIALVRHVTFLEDCIVLCHKNSECRRVSFMKVTEQCFMSGSNLQPEIDAMSIYSVVECEVFDIGHRKGKKFPKSLESSPAEPAICGQPRFKYNWKQRSKRIIGGRVVKFYSNPWMVSFLKISATDQKYSEHLCGGSIISSDEKAESSCFVLSAAHCFVSIDEVYQIKYEENNIRNLLALAGSHDSRFTEAHEQKSRIYKIFVHKGVTVEYQEQDAYKSKYYSNDIAVVELGKCFTFNSYVGHICLPNTPPLINKDYFLSGWGSFRYVTSIAAPMVPSFKLRTAIVLSVIQTGEHLFTTEGSHRGGKMDLGDSGGPLFRKHNDRYTIFGIGNLVFDCFACYNLQTYIHLQDRWTSVYHHLWWIENIFKNVTNLFALSDIIYV